MNPTLATHQSHGLPSWSYTILLQTPSFELKERIKEIDDPDKQRKMEAREERRDRKKAAPKMKQLKVKAM